MSTAISATSTSAMTMFGDLPPNSSVTGMRFSAAWAITLAPTTSEPVNDTRSTPGCDERRRPTSAPPTTTLSTPSGRPASRISSPRKSVVSGVRGDGSSTTVQPAASAAPNLKIARLRGKL